MTKIRGLSSVSAQVGLCEPWLTWAPCSLQSWPIHMDAHVAVLHVRFLPGCHGPLASHPSPNICGLQRTSCSSRYAPTIHPSVQPCSNLYSVQATEYKTRYTNHLRPRRNQTNPTIVAAWRHPAAPVYLPAGNACLQVHTSRQNVSYAGEPCSHDAFFSSCMAPPPPPPVVFACQPWLCYYPRPPAESLAEQRPLRRNLAPKMAIAPHTSDQTFPPGE